MCCGKREFKKKIEERKDQNLQEKKPVITVYNGIKPLVVIPQEPQLSRAERIKARAERIAMRAARIALRNSSKENPKKQ